MRFRLLAAALLSLIQGGCAAPGGAGPQGNSIIYVIERGWHTDIGLPVDEITGPLTVMESAYPGVRFLTFGFGERNVVVNRDRSVVAMLGALLPSKSAVLMTALKAEPGEAFGTRNVVALKVSQASLRAIELKIWQEFERPDGREPAPLADGPYPGSTFYAARETYDGFHTCNTWTADALRSGGLINASTGILFSGQVMDLARRIANPP